MEKAGRELTSPQSVCFLKGKLLPAAVTSLLMQVHTSKMAILRGWTKVLVPGRVWPCMREKMKEEKCLHSQLYFSVYRYLSAKASLEAVELVKVIES